MSVEDLVKRMLFWETFVHDVEEFYSQGGFDSRVPRRVVPCDDAGFLRFGFCVSLRHRQTKPPDYTGISGCNAGYFCVCV